MEKILILTYSFPPCNLTASQRVMGWAEYLSEYGYYPIIITRNWDKIISKPHDVYHSSGDKIIHEKHEKYEVYYLPYKSNLSGRMYIKYGDNSFKYFRKFLTFSGLMFQSKINRLISFNNIYFFARDFLTKNTEIKKIIITANPYVMFKFGYLLSKELKIRWIADYRDDWTTDELNLNKNLFYRIVKFFDKRNELKWVGSANVITTVSEKYKQKILSLFPSKTGAVIYNGFSETNFIKKNFDTNRAEFRITFNGTLYGTQPIELFLEGIKKVIDFYKTKINITIFFPGLAYNSNQENRVKKYMANYMSNVLISQRIPREEVLQLQMNSQLLLMITHSNIKGVPSSKLFEYVGLQKPILVCPSDDDIIDKVVTETGLGIICNSSEEIFNKLKGIINNFMETGIVEVTPKPEAIYSYSRKSQVKELASVLDKL